MSLPLLVSKIASFATLETASSLAKYLGWVLLLINARSFPLVWHYKVFELLTWLRIKFKVNKLLHVFSSRATLEASEEAMFDKLSPIGLNPFDLVFTHHNWASPDDSDFNGHLSNSSYAKTLDAARFEMAINAFISTMRVGGWMPLAATNYYFHKEIPMLAQYEVRISIGAWDSKWIYIVSRFVTKGGKKSSKKSHKGSTTPLPQTEFNASIRTPADGTDTPGDSSDEASGAALKAMSASLLANATQEPDGATLHCLSVSQMCFKVGRITIPPALILGCSGFTHLKGYSRKNPPPSWNAAKALVTSPTGGVKPFQKFLTGGWRDVPEGSRWWEEAVGGEVEDKRKANLEVLGQIRSGMDGARNVR